MGQSIHLIKYFYETGVYGIKDLVNMVKKKEITEEQFFEITRTHCSYSKESFKKE